MRSLPRVSVKPYFEINRKRVADVPTIVYIRRPALSLRISHSSPMIAESRKPMPSSIILSKPDAVASLIQMKIPYSPAPILEPVSVVSGPVDLLRARWGVGQGTEALNCRPPAIIA